MPRLIWSPGAIRDVSRLRRFLHDKSPDAAKRAVAAIRDGTRLLAEHPQAGRTVEGLPPNVRERPIAFGSFGYLLRYRLVGERVVVISVRHSREAGFR